jgi:hypothetical protein
LPSDPAIHKLNQWKKDEDVCRSSLVRRYQERDKGKEMLSVDQEKWALARVTLRVERE